MLRHAHLLLRTIFIVGVLVLVVSLLSGPDKATEVVSGSFGAKSAADYLLNLPKRVAPQRVVATPTR